MTNYEKWKSEHGYEEPSKMSIICINTYDCEECPIYKKFRICENIRKIEKWLNEECDENE